MRVVIAAGGTAGHVNPALALAEALSSEEVSFIGTERGLEAIAVPEAGWPFETISVRGFDRARPLSIVPVGTRALGAVLEARRILKRLGAHAVVGMGGYVSLPVCLAAATRRTPVVLHEQNIVLGLAHRVCKPVAKKLAVSFEITLAEAGRKGLYTGNPVSPEVARADVDAERRRGLERFGLEDDRRTLIVFGGSQGAKRINEAAVGLASLWAGRSDLQVLHITGRVPAHSAGHRIETSDRLIYRSVEYTHRMVEAYAVADLAVCRGGATTVAELCVMGLPSIIVPYPYHRDKQQERHAQVLSAAGAAMMVPDEDATGLHIASEAEALLGDEAALQRMSKAALSLARPDAADRLAALVAEVAA